MDRENVIWLALGLGGVALLLIFGLPLIFMLLMGGGMMGGMMTPMFFFAAPLVLTVCLTVLVPMIVVGAVIYTVSRNHKPAAQ